MRGYGPWGHERARRDRVTEHTRDVLKAPKLQVLGAPSRSPTLGGAGRSQGEVKAGWAGDSLTGAGLRVAGL